MEKLVFISDEDEEIEFYIIDETRVNGVNYLLVSESADETDEETECYILKDTSDAENPEAVYEFVEDDTELDAVGEVFSKLLEDDE